ncbi:MAG: hypothetical protein IJ461_00690, partial [Clostridia bacterium]|nr:hypothetical protein [Clostridia bacterium]
MKKYVCLILLGVLLCLAMTAQAAALPDEYMFPFDMAQTQAGIYYLCQDDLGQMRLYLYKGQELMAVGDLLPESEPEGVTGLISADKLLGYNARSGKVFQLTPEANGISVSQVAQLDLSTLSPEGEGSVFIQSVALCGKTLYLTYYSCDQNATAAWLAAFDMTTGQGKQLPLCGPICAAPYSNERLLVIASPAQSQAPEGYYLPQQPELMAYDPQTGAFTALAALEGYAFSGL